MGILNGVNQVGLIQFGNRSDVCELSARELAVKDQIDLNTARRALRGKYEGKKVVKIRQSGADIVISLDMIHKISKENPSEVVAEEILDEQE